MDFSEIPQYLTNKANYCVDAQLSYFKQIIMEFVENEGLQLNPEFQRGHVWKEEQQSNFVEHILKGGRQGREIYLNKPSWHRAAQTDYDDFVCVDGLQRITAITQFMDNKIKAFGYYRNEFTGRIRDTVCTMKIHINDLQREEDVLQWYIEMNTGGTPHTDEEIKKVKMILDDLKKRS